MTGTLAEALARLRELIGAIDQAATLAMRAQAEARQAHTAYHQAGTGGGRPDIRRAEADTRTAAEKAGKTARLLAEAANAVVDYINAVTPGTVPARYSAPDAMPSGQTLLDNAAEHSSNRFGRATRTMVAKADDLGDVAKGLTRFVEVAPRAQGGTAATVQPTAPAVSPPPAGSSEDLVGALVVVGIIAAAAAKKIGDYLARRKRRQ